MYIGSQASTPTPTTHSPPLHLTLTPTTPLAPASFLIHTAPYPQVTALLPPGATPPREPAQFVKTLALLLPTLSLPASRAVYERDPSPHITAISTGFAPPAGANAPGAPAGLVIQSSPAQLGVAYERETSNDAVVRAAFWRAVELGGLLPPEMIRVGRELGGREAQVKRWKYAQTENAVRDGVVGDEERIKVGREEEGEWDVVVLEGGRVLVAGDGTVRRGGGVEGAWRAGMAAARITMDWLRLEEQHDEAVGKL